MFELWLILVFSFIDYLFVLGIIHYLILHVSTISLNLLSLTANNPQTCSIREYLFTISVYEQNNQIHSGFLISTKSNVHQNRKCQHFGLMRCPPNCLFLKIHEIYTNKYSFNLITFIINKRFLSGYDIILYTWSNNLSPVANDI